MAAAVIAGIGASVCCVGPLVLLMIGVGGAWVGNLLAFEPYRPIFIGICFGFLALAYYKLYVAPQICAPGQTCANPIVLRRQRVVFWLVAVLTISLLALPKVASVFL